MSASGSWSTWTSWSWKGWSGSSSSKDGWGEWPRRDPADSTWQSWSSGSWQGSGNEDGSCEWPRRDPADSGRGVSRRWYPEKPPQGPEKASDRSHLVTVPFPYRVKDLPENFMLTWQAHAFDFGLDFFNSSYAEILAKHGSRLSAAWLQGHIGGEATQ